MAVLQLASSVRNSSVCHPDVFDDDDDDEGSCINASRIRSRLV